MNQEFCRSAFSVAPIAVAESAPVVSRLSQTYTLQLHLAGTAGRN